MKKILLLAVLSIGMPMTSFLTSISIANGQEETPSVFKTEGSTDRINRKPQTGRPIPVKNNNNVGCCQVPPNDTQTAKEISAPETDPNSILCAGVRCAPPGYQK